MILILNTVYVPTNLEYLILISNTPTHSGGMGQSEHHTQCLGVGQLGHHIQCLGVGQLERHIQCLGVGQLEHHIQCLGLGQLEHNIHYLRVGLPISVVLCVVYLLHTSSLHF